MSTTLRGSRLIDSCSPSISYDAQVQSASAAFDPQMWEIIDETGQVILIPNIMGLTDETLVDVLAWQFHVDGYDASASLESRKQLVQDSIRWHMTKGTVALVQEVIDTYWPGGATLQEWFQYKSPLPPNYPDDGWHERYYFRILVNQDVIAPADEAAVLELVNRYKPISRWCEEVLHSKPAMGAVYAAGYAQFFTYLKSAAPALR
jgi:hypothetical protein